MPKPVTATKEQAAGFGQSLLLSARQDIAGAMVRYGGAALLFAITCSSVLAVLLIFVFVLQKAVPFFIESSLFEFFSSRAWYPTAEPAAFGALALIAGSLYVTAASLLFAVPPGILTAVFLSDVVSSRVRNLVKPLVEILAAIPSVAYGFFAVLVVAPWMQKNLGFATGTNALNASIILSVMALPTIISISEDSISAVGRDLREASYALGSTRLETMLRVVIPAAHSGIIAGVILGMMRAIGETMVVWMASGNASQIPHPWWDLSQSIRTITATIAGDMGEAPEGSMHRHALFGLGVLLLLLTFLLNIVSEYFLSRARKARGTE